MDLTRIILGSIVTEKAERLKTDRTYTLRVAPEATKIEVRRALQKFYDVEVSSVRVLRVRPKVRLVGSGRTIDKRKRSKRMLVTLTPKSKALDIVAFKAA